MKTYVCVLFFVGYGRAPNRQDWTVVELGGTFHQESSTTDGVFIEQFVCSVQAESEDEAYTKALALLESVRNSKK